MLPEGLVPAARSRPCPAKWPPSSPAPWARDVPMRGREISVLWPEFVAILSRFWPGSSKSLVFGLVCPTTSTYARHPECHIANFPGSCKNFFSSRSRDCAGSSLWLECVASRPRANRLKLLPGCGQPKVIVAANLKAERSKLPFPRITREV